MSLQEGGDCARADANNHERETGGEFAPGVAINGVEHPNAKNVVRGVSEKLNNRESPQLRMRAEQDERAHGIGPAQRKIFAALGWKRFRDEQVTIKPVR